MDILGFISNRRLLAPGLALLVLIALATLPLYGTFYAVILITAILMYTIITVSWVLFCGPTGYMSLATAAFFGIGIYTSAILLPSTGAVLPLLVVVALGGLLSFIIALPIGAITLRLKGIYFAIFTFGMVEFIKQLVIFWEMTVTSTRGRYVMMVDNDTIFYVILGIFVLLMLTTYFIKHSKFGLALQSIGENEEAAAHRGVNVTLLKVITFAISAFFMGATGAIIATRWTYIEPYIAFDALFSFLPVLMAVFGGMGQIYGPVIGSVIFAYLEEILLTKFPYYYMLIFGVVLVVVILYMPGGIAGLVQRLWRRRLRGQHANT
ncbi:MAG: branched-chain amino acid ABC transporter permease [Dehalococcoidia bacterium]